MTLTLQITQFSPKKSDATAVTAHNESPKDYENPNG
jgi:hypothetical protein